MQYAHVLKKINFDLLTPIPRVEMWGSVSKYLLPCCCFRDSLKFCIQNSDSAAFWFLLLDMQHDCSEKVEFWPFDPTKVWDPGLWSKITFFYVSYWMYLCLHANFPIKIQLTELLQNFNIWPMTPPKGSGGGLKNLSRSCLSSDTG